MKGVSRGISVVRRSKTNDGNPIDCAEMVWIIAIAFFGFCWWRVIRARERTTELAAAGILRSPLYWLSNALVAVLLGLVLYIASVARSSFPLARRPRDHCDFAFPASRVEMALSLIA